MSKKIQMRPQSLAAHAMPFGSATNNNEYINLKVST